VCAVAIAFVSDVHPAAAAYYRQAKKEPIAPSGDLAVTSIVPLDKKASVEDLLKLIAKKTPRGGDILIVSHGTDDGLILHWTAGNRSDLDKDTINAFLDSSKSNADKVKVLQLKDEKTLKRLQGVWQTVQKLQLGRVEFRSCHVGQFDATLGALRRFFGAKIAGAPDLEDAYAPLGNPESDADWKKNKNMADAVSDSVGGGVVEYLLEQNPASTTEFKFHWRADTTKAQAAWLNKYFIMPKPATPGVHPSVLHGILSRERKFIHFPKDASYRDHLKSTTS